MVSFPSRIRSRDDDDDDDDDEVRGTNTININVNIDGRNYDRLKPQRKRARQQSTQREDSDACHLLSPSSGESSGYRSNEQCPEPEPNSSSSPPPPRSLIKPRRVRVPAPTAKLKRTEKKKIYSAGKPPLNYTPTSPCADQFHATQYNIGVELLKKFTSTGAYDLAWTGRRFNLLVIGPAAAGLQAQTKDRLNKLFGSRNFPNYDCFRHKTVTNSSSLPSLQHQFFDAVSADPDLVNLVVHDEGHWGIAKESNIHKFFVELVRRELKNLMVLVVSATPYVIEDILEDNAVNWQNLRNSGSPYFKSPTYRSVFDLSLTQDERLLEGKEGTNSDIVLMEYVGECGIAKEVLDDIKKHKGPVMAVVRFSKKQRAELCAQILRKSLRGFFVLALTDDTSIRRALDKEMKRGCGLALPPDLSRLMMNKRNVITADQLGELRVVLVLVGKISLGETVPKTLKFFDIRGKYAACTPASTIVQDLGRCAGYNKPDVKCFVSFDENLAEILKTRRLDGLLTEKRKYTKAHPNFIPKVAADGDGEVLVYEELKDNTVLLFGEPQIGKTGAVLGLLFLINNLQRRGPQ